MPASPRISTTPVSVAAASQLSSSCCSTASRPKHPPRLTVRANCSGRPPGSGGAPLDATGLADTRAPSCRRPGTSSLCNRDATWLSTVRSETQRRAAISAFVRRSATATNTSSSRLVTPRRSSSSLVSPSTFASVADLSPYSVRISAASRHNVPAQRALNRSSYACAHRRIPIPRGESRQWRRADRPAHRRRTVESRTGMSSSTWGETATGWV